MKKLILFSSILALCESCTETKDFPGDIPGEWMYSQRAYPSETIDHKSVKEAWSFLKTKQQNKSSITGEWELEGPLNTGGRITDVAISPANDAHLYVSAATGGLFRSYDLGASWESIFDGVGRPSIGDFVIAPSDAQRIYVGTGEANGSGTSGAFFGDGVYRSDDAGDTWLSMGLEDTEHIGRVVVDPINPDRVFVAAAGRLYGKNDERGVYRSVNGGTDWEQVLFLNDSTACIDLIMHPTNTDILYAAMWERTRMPWQRDYGGLSSGVHRSTDGGDTWELVENGLPEPDEQTGRIGLAISHSNPDVVYVSYTTDEITNEFHELYKTENGGISWSEISNGNLSGINSTFGWYFGNLRVNPIDPDEVWVLGQQLSHFDSDLQFWNFNDEMHVDHHAIEFSLNNPNLMLAGNDGGAYLSTNGGQNWSHFENLPITQCYQIEVDRSQPERIYAGTQDNNTIRTVTGETDDYAPILGGDGFHVIVDYTDSDIIYAEYQLGNLFHSFNDAFFMDFAMNGIDPSERTNWNTPVTMSPSDPNTLYYGAERLYRTTDQAFNWSAISPDLTNGEHPSGAGSYATITSIATSHQNENVLYAGTDDGNVQRSLNGGTSWELVTEGLPNRYVSGLVVHPEDPLTCYVAFSGYRSLDFVAHLFKTTNGGDSWTSVSGDLPDMPINDVVIDTASTRLYIATDIGVWYSNSDGNNWNLLGTNLPGVIASHLVLHAETNMLYVGTYGRSIYSYDLSQLDVVGLEEIAQASVNVYPNPAYNKLYVEGIEDLGIMPYLILDLQGRTVQRGQLETDPFIDVSRLKAGQYHVVLRDGDAVKEASFFKE